VGEAEAITHINGQARVVIEGVTPEIDGGRFAVKRVPGEEIQVEADIFADGHDVISAVLKWRQSEEVQWQESPMQPLVNDRWAGSFTTDQPGIYVYTIEGWVDHFQSWRRDLDKKVRAGQELTVDLQIGAEWIAEALHHAKGAAAAELKTAARTLIGKEAAPLASTISIALSSRLSELMSRFAPRSHATTYRKELQLVVDPPLARFSAWYELFPRSCAATAGGHGTFADCARLVPRVAGMGFDVLYLPPIHPIGRAFRKGRNNTPVCEAEEPGSPWAIGGPEGGHKAIHPQLGTLKDFRALVRTAQEAGLEIALDIAFQCSPDHPWVKEHPDWFRKRPDGTIQYAENPPKKYQDIYPVNFETEDWQALWVELKSVFEHWMENGLSIFRVDNPHTKSFRFWEWCLNGLKRQNPKLIFLSESFTRPKVMYRLAKLGFTQSYNYFPWRNTKWELTQYFTELRVSGVREYFRPNLWPNTPDILPQFLQYGGRPGFMIRLILAATLGASYGIYGPAFELCEQLPREAGSEEYLNSEKYEIRVWERDAPGNLSELMRKLNRIRRENGALQSDERLYFHPTDNEQLIAYSKQAKGTENTILTVVNLDPHHKQRGWVQLDLEALRLKANESYQVHELLTDARYFWSGPRNYVELDPHFVPAHVFALRRHVRREHDFDYFM